MARKKETITLSIPPGTKEQLEAIAAGLGIMWGDHPSISGLVVAIAQRQLEIGSVLTLDLNQNTAIRQAIKLLVDSGRIADAQTLALFLLEHGNLETPLRQALLEQVSHPTESWRRVIDQQIKAKQPFYLFYEDSQNKQMEFTVRYGEIRFWEKRFYLEAWCEETEGSLNLPELIHNRCFRLDRIINVLPASGDWQDQLEYVEVQLQLLGRLVKAYEPKPDDITNEVKGDARYVARRVSNTFWFIREILRYGEECIVVSPASVQDQLISKLKKLCEHYKFLP
ncbi:transcriptional regulator [filamentous cyanobacterium CCP1]|jgi:predicted DNA-binding transcriptional regulator YafY|nr:transcriptional regulator [filamentous cyanobacterium CCP2]PSB67418.1 transcriptional regulator [filamentous cyanobacterium CCP1]